MRRHLFNVAEALQRGSLPGIDSASRGVIQAERFAPPTRRRAQARGG